MCRNGAKENYKNSGQLLPRLNVFFSKCGTRKFGRMSSRNQITKASVLMTWNRYARMHKN